MFSASTDIWRYQFHPEVRFIVLSSVLLAYYAIKVVGPNAVKGDEPVITKKHKYAFVAAIAFLWFASDWPMHDISEEYLYSAHMLQHPVSYTHLTLPTKA